MTPAPVWGPLEFWACYCGLRPVPPPLPPRRHQLIERAAGHPLRPLAPAAAGSLIEEHQLDPAAALDALA
jgi:hypothetical protein